ncbi:MAG: LTA synthase family protein [Puniceicoccales bacterium]|jgi:lipoteichoic acid synthase|nr:LTA synthase family protein [Puniceicoccales bacterium]
MPRPLTNFIHVNGYTIILTLWFGAEAFVIQELTISSPHNNIINSLGIKSLRALIDFSFAYFLIATLQRKYQMLLYNLFEFILSLTFLTYYRYFKVPISLDVIATQFHEFMAIANIAIPLISPTATSMLLLSLIIKTIIINKLQTYSCKTRYLYRSFHILLALIFWQLLVAISYNAVTCNSYHPSYIRQRLLEAYGYLNTFTIEIIYNCKYKWPTFALAKKLYDNRKNNLILNLPLKPFRNIIVVQVESLDHSVLDLKLNDKEVTPFLNFLKKSAMVKKVFHKSIYCSANADYSVLTGAKYPGLCPYAFSKNSYFSSLETLPKKLIKFKSTSYHGCHGDFYSRKISYSSMGFREIYFLEDLEPLGLKKKIMGVRDGDLFNFAVNRLNDNKNDKNFIFIITLTSHCHFHMTPTKNIYPDGTDEVLWKKYINSINYVDQCFLDLYNKIPEDTVIVLYGDHISHMDYEGAGKLEVPLMIFQKGNDIHDGTISKTTHGDLKLHDIHWLICSIVEKSSTSISIK